MNITITLDASTPAKLIEQRAALLQFLGIVDARNPIRQGPTPFEGELTLAGAIDEPDKKGLRWLFAVEDNFWYATPAQGSYSVSPSDAGMWSCDFSASDGVTWTDSAISADEGKKRCEEHYTDLTKRLGKAAEEPSKPRRGRPRKDRAPEVLEEPKEPRPPSQAQLARDAKTLDETVPVGDATAVDLAAITPSIEVIKGIANQRLDKFATDENPMAGVEGMIWLLEQYGASHVDELKPGDYGAFVRRLIEGEPGTPLEGRLEGFNLGDGNA